MDDLRADVEDMFARLSCCVDIEAEIATGGLTLSKMEDGYKREWMRDWRKNNPEKARIANQRTVEARRKKRQAANHA